MAATVNIFGFVTPSRCPLEVPHDEKTGLPTDVMIQQKLDFDKETGSTKVNTDDKQDLYQIIQTYADQCGVEYIRNLVAKGMANPDKFADDGNHSADLTLPIDPNDMYRKSLASDQSLSILAKELGIELSPKTTDEEIAKAIVARITPKNQDKPVEMKPIEGGDK